MAGPPSERGLLWNFVIQVVWGSLTRGMSQTGLEVREGRKKYFGILPSFGDLLELIVLIWWLWLCFPRNMATFEYFVPNYPFGQFTLDYFFVITLSDKKHTHTHTSSSKILLNLTRLRLSNNTKGMSNDVALKRYHIALTLVLWLKKKKGEPLWESFFRVKYGQRWQWVCSQGGGLELWGLFFD